MGEFSFTKAIPDGTNVMNILGDRKIRLYIPEAIQKLDKYHRKEIRGTYDNYGRITENQSGRVYDVHELLAVWNADAPYGDLDQTVKDFLRPIDGDNPIMPTDSGWGETSHTDDNRIIGIDLFFFRKKLPYTLKMMGYKIVPNHDTYETIDGESYSDPNQGWNALSYEEWEELHNRYKNAEPVGRGYVR